MQTLSAAPFADLPNLGPGHPSEPIIAHILAQPGIQRVPNPKVAMFIGKKFIAPEMCEKLIAQIDARRRPSTIADSNGDYAFRTSETCDLDPDDPLVIALKRRIIALTGLDPAHAEPMQGQRYEVGQEFKAHTDYFEPSGADYAKYCSVAGQRTWTVMLYLNDVEAGGVTRFKAIDKMVEPETGKILAWNNLRANGTPNPSTIHHAMKVRAGTKYVITQWFRERPWGW
ncbi:prolyl 4-hydroxylase [Sphingomonas naasensis]|uniref:2OG-Fe(II) oxygenase n=1 Tax=Sphingomonas naasensis TaxID=1344951 RepID=A0A4S1WSQ4_9SPHN|nr:2OG-Fe(II) oxygenase [Sphingomonas naasensis]NIJ18872.1 prolyl 4-hydroxylase [Sphingomonas naasensis]TGX46093.1 2OG-Fe(II) oxygenase [Sphingomonas naasensis]